MVDLSQVYGWYWILGNDDDNDDQELYVRCKGDFVDGYREQIFSF